MLFRQRDWLPAWPSRGEDDLPKRWRDAVARREMPLVIHATIDARFHRYAFDAVARTIIGARELPRSRLRRAARHARLISSPHYRNGMLGTHA